MKIVIVEDEIRIREGIIKLLGKIFPQHQIVGVAENGEDGLNLIETTNPDLVITDVKMPKIDGLQMISELHRKERLPKVIILSAYSEFEFAQKAIKLGVSEYLLKPISVADFTKSIKAIETQLSKSDKIDNLQSIQNVMNNVLYNNLVVDEKIERFLINKYSIDAKGTFIMIPVYMTNKTLENEKRIKKNLKNIFCEKNDNIIIKDFQQDMFIVLFHNVEDVEGIKKWFRWKIKNDIKMRDQRGICFGWIEFKGIENIIENHGLITKYLEWNIGTKDNILISYPEIKEVETEAALFPIDIERKMTVAICAGDNEKIKKLMSRFCKHFSDGKVYFPKEVKECFVRFIWSIVNVIKGVNVQQYNKIELHKLIDKIMSSVMFEELEEILQELEEYTLFEKVQEEDMKNMLVVRIKAIIHEFYNQGITLDEISYKLKMTPEYLGSLFHKEEGINYSTYLKRYRIGKAKELLLGTNLKIFEIATRVGYQDPKYFSKVFKEVTGELPAKYKKRRT